MKPPSSSSSTATSFITSSSSHQSAKSLLMKKKLLVQFQIQTKHEYPNNYAPSKGFLDWKNQPNPYRSFIGDDAKPLQTLSLNEELILNKSIHLKGFDEIYLEQKGMSNENTASNIHLPSSSVELNEKSLSEFMFYSMSLSATKKYKHNSWSLRVNPSSGNLHPCEVYCILDCDLSDLTGQTTQVEKKSSTHVYSYHPKYHALQLRCEWSTVSLLKDLLFKTNQDKHNDKNRFFAVGLCTVNYRETWKYGIRSYRYSQLDSGHAIAALKYSASLFGWDCIVLNDHPLVTSKLMETVLGLDQFNDTEMKDYEKEKEKFEAIIMIDTKPNFKLDPYGLHIEHTLPVSNTAQEKPQLYNDIVNGKIQAQRYGKPNLLCHEHQHWPQMEPIPELCSLTKPYPSSTLSQLNGSFNSLYQRKPIQFLDLVPCTLTAQQVIRTRRSAQNFDGVTFVENKHQFFSMLEKLLPSRYPSLWRCLSPFDNFTTNGCNTHLVLFVHRVKGVESGMYLLYRGMENMNDASTSESVFNKIKQDWNMSFDWKKVDQNLPLFKLVSNDLRKFAKLSSCLQDIASDSCFSIAMVTFNFGNHIAKKGPYGFKELYWEAGYIGHILYLEAERIGLRATGIGCFFDDTILENVLQIEEEDVYSVLNELDDSEDSDIDEIQNYQDLYHFTIGKPVEDTRIQSISPYIENYDQFE
ncbi:hypothetical protein C9374_012401 [Naegleria lovaniensis]|uniref:Nitroreductase domain-containing protein n=1 Tax=Naegleria lovaniensis TaxID=51637 RepID=A0AA88H1V6_NAELO|nr:uncharacterized protein C9374_012401 [Naegleria lovaniensis]KAG2392149.1 hypothetical protein C9374_012401 [Naegleria lovaniensis]